MKKSSVTTTFGLRVQVRLGAGGNPGAGYLKNMNNQQRSSRWLLCDFHIHTQWSDGAELIKTVVDLYGASGFDAICITDHILDAQFWQRFPQARAIAPP